MMIKKVKEEVHQAMSKKENVEVHQMKMMEKKEKETHHKIKNLLDKNLLNFNIIGCPFRRMTLETEEIEPIISQIN